MRDHVRGYFSHSSIGGIFGAFIGILFSSKIHKKEDKVYKKAGETAAMSGLGYLLGDFIEKKIKEHRKV
jgi:hypothetical protein